MSLPQPIQHLAGAVVLESALGAVSFGMEKNRAKLQGRVLRDPETPVIGNAGPGILEIAIYDLQQVRYLLPAALVVPQPFVFSPTGQGHAESLLYRASHPQEPGSENVLSPFSALEILQH